MLWANQYRPQTFDDMVGGARELEYLTEYPQHLLLHSRGAGRGKTTLAHVMANALGYPIHVFNASSKKTRGIAFVEQELIPLTRSGNKKQYILLDEADQLTAEAQSALKGVIENADGYFILTCNDISKVSPWLQSRCLKIQFMPISEEDMMGRLTYVCGAEGVAITESQLGLICKAHSGDLRNAINALQAFASIADPVEKHKFLLGLGETTLDLTLFLKLCLVEKDFAEALSMIKEGDARKTVRSIFRHSLTLDNLKDETVLLVIDASVTAERDILQGVEEDIVKANYVRMIMSESL